MLGTSKCVHAARSHIQDYDSEVFTSTSTGLADSLKVLYKYCYDYSLKHAKLEANFKYGPYPVIKKDDKADLISTFAVHEWLLHDSFSCNFEMTDDPDRQHEVDISKADPAYNEYAAKFKVYKGRPDKAWFELSVDKADEELVRNALTDLYVSATRLKPTGNFYINSWEINGKCGISEGSPKKWRSMPCLLMLSAEMGQLKFTANERMPEGNAIKVWADDTLEAAKIGTTYKELCKGALSNIRDEYDEHIERRFEGIASKLCEGQLFESESNVVTNVGWDDERGFYWK